MRKARDRMKKARPYGENPYCRGTYEPGKYEYQHPFLIERIRSNVLVSSL